MSYRSLMNDLRHGGGYRTQAGASLLFALIALVALGLAASALVRSVDTGAVVLGNLGAKKATSIAADRAIQKAIQFLNAKGNEKAREVDDANNGYYASSKEDFDITGFDRPDSTRKLINWEIDGSCAYAKPAGDCQAGVRPGDKLIFNDLYDDGSGIEARWFITRLCEKTGDYPTSAASTSSNNCAMPLKGSYLKDQGTGEKNYAFGQAEMENPVPYYRVVVRVTGPRNAVTYAETIVNFKAGS
jgi:hypothetical protein